LLGQFDRILKILDSETGEKEEKELVGVEGKWGDDVVGLNTHPDYFLPWVVIAMLSWHVLWSDICLSVTRRIYRIALYRHHQTANIA